MIKCGRTAGTGSEGYRGGRGKFEWKEACRGLDEKYRLIVVTVLCRRTADSRDRKICSCPTILRCAQRLARGREQLARYYAETEEGGGRK